MIFESKGSSMSNELSPAPAAYQGPDEILTGAQNALHELCNVFRDLVHKVPHTYHSEQEVLDARAKIDNYEKHALGVLKYEASRVSFDRSAHEDVSGRVPAAPAPGVVGQQIDYRELAKAMLALQQEGGAIEPTSVVTGAEQQNGAGL